MKLTIAIAALLVTTVSFAQRTKPMTYTTTTTTQTTAPSYSGYGQNDLTVTAGFTRGALNLGATYAMMQGSTGLGGYFQLQTEKSKVVDQVIALGALYKINVIDTAKAVFYAAPGVGLAIVKVSSKTGTGTDDKTVFGPSLKLGAQLKMTPTFALGVERMIATNWFDEDAAAAYELTSLAMTFVF